MGNYEVTEIVDASYFSDCSISYSRLPSQNLKIRRYGNTALLFVSVCGTWFSGKDTEEDFGTMWDELTEALRKL